MVSNSKEKTEKRRRQRRFKLSIVDSGDNNDDRSVFNISSYTLNEHEMAILKKGLKFAPSTSNSQFNTFIDLHKFIGKLTVKKNFFENKYTKCAEEEGYTHTDLHPQSTFYPQQVKSDTIRVFERLVEKDLRKLNKRKKSKDNLTPKERQVLKSLMSNPNKIIRSADKGGGHNGYYGL
ncbi:Hypothetical predicted protein [Pelobates cultripes]|uniref:Uncharacterized protein n=1 Tax=Pelobates cultripes TaxID=61616 RepID=A0AAD1RXG5_PELCU|nr:Hypothetical predicted protein [Pelobates cultripes]